MRDQHSFSWSFLTHTFQNKKWKTKRIERKILEIDTTKAFSSDTFSPVEVFELEVRVLKWIVENQNKRSKKITPNHQSTKKSPLHTTKGV